MKGKAFLFYAGGKTGEVTPHNGTRQMDYREQKCRNKNSVIV